MGFLVAVFHPLQLPLSKGERKKQITRQVSIMAFYIKKSQSLRKNVRRIVRQQICKAIKNIHMAGGNDEEAVHGIRKCIKRIRAVLRLIRAEIGEPTYQCENKRYRSVAQPLTMIRNTRVIAGTLDELSEHAQNQFNNLSVALREEHQQVRQRELGQSLSQVKEMLVQSYYRVSRWHLRRDHWKTIHQGMKKMRRQCKRAMKTTLNQNTPENLHEWRKRSKYYWHQLEIMSPISKSSKALVHRVHKLTDYLGNDRDLFMLLDRAKEILAPHEQENLESLSMLIACKRHRLQKKSFRLGREIFSS